MKRIAIVFILCVHIIYPPQGASGEGLRRGLFVSVIQTPPVLSSRQDIDKLIDFARRSRIGILFVQIYYGNKAWFPSHIADDGPYRTLLSNMPEDPFAYLIAQAHKNSIEVHAWMNILSLGANKDAPFIKKYGAGILTKNLKEKGPIEDYAIDDQYFLEPGDLRVREELSNILDEALRAYPGLDGVQFDYIRYPDEDPAYGYTQTNIERYRKATGNAVVDEDSPVWKDWKRAQVTEVLEAMAERARSLRPGIKVSATGCMPYHRAYLEAFQDWPSWIERGLVEYVTVMSYSSVPDEFGWTILMAKAKTADFSKVNIAIGAYKLVRSPDVFEQELRIAEDSGAGGIAVFHYGNIVENPALGRCLIEDRDKR
ncbi:MAG: family 10 glycosylhydrolase [Candidatus Omnitrophota bacterium]